MLESIIDKSITKSMLYDLLMCMIIFIDLNLVARNKCMNM